MVVHLQRERRAGLDLDALDLVALAALEHGVRAPRAHHGAVQPVAFVAAALELGHDFLDLLGAAGIGDQQRVGRVDHHHAAQAHGGDHAVLRTYEAVLAVDQQRIAVHAVAVLVRLHQPGDGRPRADVVPRELGGQHHEVAAGFHHRVVDRDVLRLRKALDGQFGELRGAVGQRHLLPAFREAARQFGPVDRQFREQRARPHAEHAAVPQEVAAFQVGAGGGGIRLLDEAAHLARLAARQVFAGLDVAIPGLGRLRLDAEGDQLALLRQRRGLLRRPQELLRRLDQVVGRQHQHDGVRRDVVGHPVRGRGNRGGGVAADRLQQVAGAHGGIDAQRASHLVFRHEIVVTVGDEQQPVARGRLGRAPHGAAQQRLPVGQLHERLGVAFAGNRPQPRARAAGQDDGHDRGCGGVGGGIGFQRDACVSERNGRF